ncbi:MAG: tetratricopeptide repeat protein [Planctomycetes bacterium]|nr:tetratricopeptide repeat protein [Planctomycetota bacterium]MBI3833960.1 tetratricopeptide repeat protein [Planctomycetota bacterium]
MNSSSLSTNRSLQVTTWSPRLCTLVIVLATLAAFEPVRHNELVWDDQQNLILNDGWRGIDASHLHWMFTTFHGGHYQPLTWLSFAVEYELCRGLNSVAIHNTNVFSHTLNALLVFAFARWVLRIVFPDVENKVNAGALIAALVFAVHPLRVESVAWATERRDVLSTFWLLLATLLYIRYAKSKSKIEPSGSSRSATIAFGMSVACYILSLLSKASGMTFPLVLLLLDWYPLRRSIRWRVFVEKLAFVVPAGIAAAIALTAQKSAGAFQALDFDAQGLGGAALMRITRAAYGIAFYLAKTAYPVGLSPLYELNPNANALDVPFLISAIGVAVAMIAVWAVRKRIPGFTAAFTLYVIILLPVLGLAQSGPQLVADRYSYLSSIPIAILAGGFVVQLVRPSTSSKFIRHSGITIGTIAALAMIFQTRQQVGVWRDGLSLWSKAVDRRPSTGLAQANLAIELNQRGQFQEACEHSERALQILPGNLAAHTTLGKASLALGDFATAKEHLLAAIDIREHLQKPDASTFAALGETFAQLGDPNRAEQFLDTARKLEPKWGLKLAHFYVNQNRVDDAHHVLTEVLTKEPEQVRALLLGNMVKKAGRVATAIEVWNAGLARFPHDVNLRAMLAWTLATTRDDALRDVDRALELASSAVQDSAGKCVRAGEAQAAAYADLDRFNEAIHELEKLLDERSREMSDHDRVRIFVAIENYKNKTPTRE